MLDDKNNSNASVPTDNSRIFGYLSKLMADLTWWNLLNSTTVAAITSFFVVAIQTPFKAALVSYAVRGSFIPPHSGGFYAFLRVLCAGTKASLSGSAARASYTAVTTKNAKLADAPLGEVLAKDELHKEEYVGKKRMKMNYGYVAAVAFGDLVVTQGFTSFAQFKKIPGFLPPDFKWYTRNNMWRLMTVGFTAKYVSGGINWGSMLLLEERVANKLPIDNPQLRHAGAGAISGVVAAVLSLPFSALHDNVLVQSRITADGNLVNKSSFQAVRELTSLFLANPQKVAKTALIYSGKQLPFRIALTAAVFTTVSGVGEALGTEPLARILPDSWRPASVATNQQRFFSAAAPKPHTLDLSEQKLQSGAESNKMK